MINPWTVPLIALTIWSAALQGDGATVALALMMAPVFVSAARQDYQTSSSPFTKIG